MLEWPDILVKSPDSPEVLLAVEVKSGAGAAQTAERQLRAYMSRRNCPAGMVVTPEDTFFLRNRFTSLDPESVEQVGKCRTEDLFGAVSAKSSAGEALLVRQVQDWLDDLRISSARWPASARDAIEWYVLPAVTGGVVASTGLRFRRTGS